MKKMWIIVLIVIAALAAAGISSYNSLVSSKEEINQSFANIDTMLQRRVDLIPNLVNTVKGYASHESEVIQSVSDARAQLAGANSVEEKAEADSALSSAISRLLMVVENYPDLKADTQFTALSDELAGTENRIAQARNEYNEKVGVYNSTIKRFPKVIFAGIMGFDKAEYFKASDNAQTVPEVKF